MSNPNPKPVPADKRFQPGVSGNPGGKPKNEFNMSYWLAIYSEKTKDELQVISKDKKLNVKQIAALNHMVGMMNGDDSKTNRYLERVEGKTVQKVQVEGLDAIESTRLAVAALIDGKQ
jgi:hypothetical protein